MNSQSKVCLNDLLISAVRDIGVCRISLLDNSLRAKKDVINRSFSTPIQNRSHLSFAKKKRQREAGVKLLRQVSYRQETYRAVNPLYAIIRRAPS